MSNVDPFQTNAMKISCVEDHRQDGDQGILCLYAAKGWSASSLDWPHTICSDGRKTDIRNGQFYLCSKDKVGDRR
jgi:hypothetical protein